MPWISVSTRHLSSLVIKPIATPATGRLIGTPASISERLEPQTEAIDDDPFDESVSETSRIVYGNSSLLGSTASSDKIVVTGGLNIGSGVLEFNDFVFTDVQNIQATTYTLIDATSITGTLGANLSGTFGNGISANLSTNGSGDLLLNVTAAPEPTGLAMLALSGGALLSRRRRKAEFMIGN